MNKETYNELKALANDRYYCFVMAVAHLFDIGYRQAVKITDKDIEAQEGNGLMTKEFVQDLVRTTRDIALIAQPIEVCQFCAIEEVFDTQLY